MGILHGNNHQKFSSPYNVLTGRCQMGVKLGYFEIWMASVKWVTSPLMALVSCIMFTRVSVEEYDITSVVANINKVLTKYSDNR